MADSDNPHDMSQQLTTKTPTTRVKDPKKVAAGKAFQKKNREARKAQKKSLRPSKKNWMRHK